MTNTRIKQLQRHAAEAGDIHMAAIAARAQCVKVIVYSDGEAIRS